MKAIIGAILLFTLTACASTLEELEQEAMMTGDWSGVELRERIKKEKEGGNLPSCKDSHVLVCVDQGSSEHCSCVRHR